MLKINRPALYLLLILDGLLFLIYQHWAPPKALVDWKWIDIASEGGASLMTAMWAMLVLGSRPKGRVTSCLAGGLFALALGSWADCLDEFFAIPHSAYWDNWFESGFGLLGTLLLTYGLFLWREEQFSLSEHMQKRERLFRDHRAFDRVTQLANADYLRRQIVQERLRRPEAPCALLLLDVDGFHRINRQYGQAEGDNVLLALTHLLLLNLRHDDLLCRYAGDRYAVLLPETGLTAAAEIGQQLAAAVRTLAHYSRSGGERIELSIRVAAGQADDAVEQLLGRLSAELENAPEMACELRPQLA